jgi:hypothetical protein
MDPRVFIGESLNPATVEKVGIDEEKKTAIAVVSDHQLSLAIGKNGQNVRLAAKLTGWKIDIMSESEYEKERAKEREKEITQAIAEEQRLQEAAAGGRSNRFVRFSSSKNGSWYPGRVCLDRPARSRTQACRDFGPAWLDTVEKIAQAEIAQLTEVPSIGEKTAGKSGPRPRPRSKVFSRRRIPSTSAVAGDRPG